MIFLSLFSQFAFMQAWQNGTFKSLYWSIFWEDPPEVKVPDFYKTGVQPTT